MNKIQQAYAVEVPALKVSLSSEEIRNDKVDGYRGIKATFAQSIADTKFLDKNRHMWFWVMDDDFAPREVGRYEIVRKEGQNGTIAVSLKKVTDERWGELSWQNRLYVYESAAKRLGRLALGVFYDWYWGRLGLVADGRPGAARVAEVAVEKSAKIAPALVEAARKSVAKLDAAVNAGVLTSEVVEPLKDLIRASE